MFVSSVITSVMSLMLILDKLLLMNRINWTINDKKS